MDSTINNSLAFQARVNCHIKGRDNIMGKVAPKVEEYTKNIKGVLEIKRPGEGYVSNLKELSMGNIEYLANMHKYLSIAPENQTEEVIDTFARRLANSVKVMDACRRYNNKAENIQDKMNDVRREYRRLKGKKDEAEKFKLPELAAIYGRKVEACKAEFTKLKNALKTAQIDLLSKHLYPMRDKGIDLKYFADSISSDFKSGATKI